MDEVILMWKGRVVFHMVKKKDWVVVKDEALSRPKKKPSAAYRRLRRLHLRSRAMVARR